MSKLYAVIFAGGSGERLWPLSTPENPKQFLALIDEQPLIQNTLDRLQAFLPTEQIFIQTAPLYQAKILSLLRGFAGRIWAEPESKDTAGAVALAALRLYLLDPESIMLTLWSDHFIGQREVLRQSLQDAALVAEKTNALVAIGIKPSRPETALGYWKAGGKVDGTSAEALAKRDGTSAEALAKGDGTSAEALAKVEEFSTLASPVFQVTQFKEKPDLKTAQNYLQSGESLYLWNAGLFAWRTAVFLQTLSRCAPEIYLPLMEIKELVTTHFPWEGEEVAEAFSKMPKISLDYAVSEKAGNFLVVMSDPGWDDIGSWQRLYELLPKDEKGNIIKGKVVSLDGQNSLILNPSSLDLAVIGVKDLIIVATNQGLLVASQDSDPNKIKEVLKKLNEENGKTGE